MIQAISRVIVLSGDRTCLAEVASIPGPFAILDYVRHFDGGGTVQIRHDGTNEDGSKSSIVCLFLDFDSALALSDELRRLVEKGREG